MFLQQILLGFSQLLVLEGLEGLLVWGCFLFGKDFGKRFFVSFRQDSHRAMRRIAKISSIRTIMAYPLIECFMILCRVGYILPRSMRVFVFTLWFLAESSFWVVDSSLSLIHI